MSVSVEVGLLADLLIHDQDGARVLKQQFHRIKKELFSRALDFDEPEILPLIKWRTSTRSFPCSFIEDLQRIAARVLDVDSFMQPGGYHFVERGWKLSPSIKLDDPNLDPCLLNERRRFKSHLICHSDVEGFYLPIDFKYPIPISGVAGGVVGSSVMLFKELIRVSSALNIKLVQGCLDEVELSKIEEEDSPESELSCGRIAWLALYEASRLSILYETAITFT